MPVETPFEITDDGEVSLPEAECLVGILRIRQLMLEDEAPVSDIMRLIALEIVEVMTQMGSKSILVKHSQKDLNDQIKGLRELQKTLSEAELFSKRDSLNMDGPKFQYIYKELVGLFQQSMKDSGLNEESVKSVMQHFVDSVRGNEERLRRDLKKMEGVGK